MKFVWLVAILLWIIFGFTTAANFVSLLLVVGMISLLVTAVFMAVSELFKLKLWDALKWAAGAAFWGWILSICF